MSRCRVYKPELLLDERLSSLTPEARLYILGAATLADRDGVLENRPLRIKLASMPHNDSDPDSIIRSLLLVGVFSISEDGRYLRIDPWNDWFSPFPKEQKTEHNQTFSCGTIIEHSIAIGLQGPCNGIAHNKHKDRSKDKGKDKNKDRELFPIFHSGDEDLKRYFDLAVDFYPTKDEGHNAKSAGWEKRRIQKNSPALQANWQSLVNSGIATARELCACSWVASASWGKNHNEYQYIPNMSTFYGPEKATWMSWLDQARAYLEKLDKEKDNEATQ